MEDKSSKEMSEAELQALRRSIGAPDDWVPGRQFQQEQQQQEQQQQVTAEWEAQKGDRPRGSHGRTDAG
jgi:hypothetical protein